MTEGIREGTNTAQAWESVGAFLEDISDAVCVLELSEQLYGDNRDFRFAVTNRSFRSTFWEGSDRYMGHLLSSVCKESTQSCLAVLNRVLTSMQTESGDVFIGIVERWFAVRAMPISASKLVLFLTDITERVQAQRQAELEASRYRMVFDTGHPRYIVTEDDLSIRDANRAALDQLGCTQDAVRERTFDDFFEAPSGSLASSLRSSQPKVVVSCSLRSPTKHSKAPLEIDVSRAFLDGERVYVLLVIDRLPLHQQKLNREMNSGDRGRLWPDSVLFHRCVSEFRRRHISAFPYIDDLLNPLLPIGRVVSYKRGEFFISAGQPSTYSGISADAYFRAFVVDSKGNEVTVQFFRPGEFIVSYTALAKKELSELYIQSLNECEVFVMDAAAFYDCMLKDQRWFILATQLLQESLFSRERREIDLLTTALRKRYDAFVASNQDLVRLLHNYQIASYLGVAPETLSRIRKKTRGS